MTLKERFMKRLIGGGTDFVPVGSTCAYGMVELMQRCGYERPLADTDPVAMAALSLAGHQYAGFEWVKAMGWDITSLSHAMGCSLGEPAIDLPYYIKTHPFEDRIEALDCPADLTERGRFPAFRRQFELIRQSVGNELAVFGMSEGPFTCAANLVGTEKLMKMTIRETAKVQAAMDVTVAAMIKAVNFAFENGADYYCIADPTSGTDLMSPRTWKQIMLPAMKKIVAEARGPIVLHICGNADMIVKMMCESGVAGISIEEKTNLEAAVETAHSMGVKVFGNVSSSDTLFLGTPEQCRAESLKALEAGVDFLAPGCGIAPLTPLENVLQMKEARDEFLPAATRP